MVAESIIDGYPWSFTYKGAHEHTGRLFSRHKANIYMLRAFDFVDMVVHFEIEDDPRKAVYVTTREMPQCRLSLAGSSGANDSQPVRVIRQPWHLYIRRHN
jgi:hypothetical protein